MHRRLIRGAALVGGDVHLRTLLDRTGAESLSEYPKKHNR